jgi:DNA-binding response OmpR family regulator
MHEPSPASPQSGRLPGGSTPRRQPLNRRARILVVEDDSLLASTVCDVLGLEGYEAECVESLPQVARLLERERFDLILTDVGIRDAPPSERDYFALLRARAPDAAILAMTGDPKGLHLVGSELGFDELIPKPFEIEELMRCVRAVLDRRAYDVAAGQ